MTYAPIINFHRGLNDGWRSALSVYGLRDCTIRNDGSTDMRVPIGRDEAFLDLAPGEEATIRTVGDVLCYASAVAL